MSYRSDQRMIRLAGMLLIGAVTLYILRALLPILDIDDPELFITDLFQLAIIILVFGLVIWALFWWLPQTLRGSFRSSGLPSSLRCSIEYLRQSLVDSERIAVNDRDFNERQNQVPTQEITAGRLSTQSFKIITKGADLTEHPVEVLIAPAVFRRSGPRGVENLPEFIIPFWIPATVLADSSLEAPERSSPWIPREYLEPVVSDGAFTFGHLSSLEDRERPSGRRFADYLRSSEEFFQSITGAKPRDLVVDGYAVQDRASVITEGQSGGNDGVTRLYNDILSSQLSPGLLPTVLSKNPRRPNRQPKRLLHTGQFESTFPLSPSQRSAVQLALALKDGEVLAVTGPPGTGKTTMIQSIVASSWVNGARRGVPPIMLSCSATNQATMNVLHSFAKAKDAPGPLQGRWLPKLDGYGLFCASESRSQDAIDLLFTLSSGEGPLSEFESEHYRKEAIQIFLDRCRSVFPKVKTIESAAKSLHREIKKQHEVLHRESVRGTTDDHALDQGLRHTLFQLATHYWEARWLLEVPALIRRVRNQRNRPTRADWEIRAMLSPLFVSTFAKAPSFFGGRVAREQPPIDLFFSDEASQTPPELAGATLALAKRGVIIGDTAQLEPIRLLPESADLGNLIHYGLIRNREDKQLSILRERGQLVSSGSLMQQALTVSISPPGVFLSEHRRSVPRIIEFSNRLSYSGNLQPLRSELETRILPAFGYAHIRGLNRRAGTSRSNAREAERIAAWIRSNKKQLETHYGLPLSELLGVITPFRAQMLLLRTKLHSDFPELLVGTVNAIQGAERPVIIFSSVYSGRQQQELYLLDRKPNLLNVAVSRAKDTFLLFGDMELFEIGKRTPSSLLAEFLFSSEENELVDIDPLPAIEEAKADKRKARTFADLDAHREALIEALQTATKRVVIVSPTISIFAIEHDSLEREVRDSVTRGVEVLIFTDEKLNLDLSTAAVKEPAARGRKLLADAGASVYIVHNIHNKSLAIDNDRLIEGSFNWLSAVRKKGSATQKYERSFEFIGAEEEIGLLLEDMNQRIIKSESGVQSPSNG